MPRKKNITAYRKFCDSPCSLLRKTHRLIELYRFLDFYFPMNEPTGVVSKNYWVKFVKWNGEVISGLVRNMLRKTFPLPLSYIYKTVVRLVQN